VPGSKINVDTGFVKAADAIAANPAKIFSDLLKNAWYYEAIEYVLSEGMMNDYGDGKFGADENLSRAQLA